MTNAAIRSLAFAVSSFALLGMSSAQAGVDAVRAEAYFNAISGGNPDTITSFYADDAEFHWVGGPLAGVYKGKDKIKGVWEKFSKAAGDLDHEVLQLSESANGKTSTVTARVKFKGAGEVPVKFVMIYKDGKIASEVWQVDRTGATYAKDDGKAAPKTGGADKAGAKPEPKVDAKPELSAEARPEPKAEPKAEAKADSPVPPQSSAAQAPGPVVPTAAVIDTQAPADAANRQAQEGEGQDTPTPDYAPKDAKALQAEPAPAPAPEAAPAVPVKKADTPPAEKLEPKGVDKKKVYGDKYDGGYEKKVIKKKRYYDYGHGYGYDRYDGYGYGGHGYGYGHRGYGYGHY
jgi:ketosteroid isomerase-like protein